MPLKEDFRMVIMRGVFSVVAPRIWNTLPQEILRCKHQAESNLSVNVSLTHVGVTFGAIPTFGYVGASPFHQPNVIAKMLQYKRK